MAEGRAFLRRRLAVSVVGLTLMSFAVVLASKAVLGTSPITSVPFVISLITPLSLGTANFLFSLVLIAAGIGIMGSLYRPIYLTQILTVLVFSAMCDMFYTLLSDMHIVEYAVQWAVIILSCVILGFGVSLLVASSLTMMPPEYLVLFISFRTGMSFGRTKVMVDLLLVTAAAIATYLHFGSFVGVREGTVFAAMTLGLIVRWMTGKLEAMGLHESMGRSASASGTERMFGDSVR